MIVIDKCGAISIYKERPLQFLAHCSQGNRLYEPYVIFIMMSTDETTNNGLMASDIPTHNSAVLGAPNRKNVRDTAIVSICDVKFKSPMNLYIHQHSYLSIKTGKV